jgi:hypothetical protein
MNFIFPLICDLLFVYFSISIFSFRKHAKLGLELPLRYILIYLIMKIGAYYSISLMSINNETFGDSYVISLLLFGGGIMIAKAINLVMGDFFHV